jgi:Ulp1 family protease
MRWIFIPVNLHCHWSLCVVYKPYLISKVRLLGFGEVHDEYSCIIHMDSLQLHSGSIIGCNIRKWLIYEWITRGYATEEVFDELYMNLTCPKG